MAATQEIRYEGPNGRLRLAVQNVHQVYARPFDCNDVPVICQSICAKH